MSSASVYCLPQAAPHKHLSIHDHRESRGEFKSSEQKRMNVTSGKSTNNTNDKVISMKGEESIGRDKRNPVFSEKYSDKKETVRSEKLVQRIISTGNDRVSMLNQETSSKQVINSNNKHFLDMIRSRPKRPKVRPPRKVAIHAPCSDDDDQIKASQDSDDDKASNKPARKSTIKPMTKKMGQEISM